MIEPELVRSLKDWAQLLGLLIGVPVAAVGLFKALYEIRANREQRAAELLWKRVNTAKELLDDIHHHELAKSAVHMLDWRESQADYGLTSNQIETISYSDVLSALGKQLAECHAKDIYIRDCFDWFFYRVDRIEHYIRRKLIEFEDVESVFKVYAQHIARDAQIYHGFLDFHGYDLARQFFMRYTPAS